MAEGDFAWAENCKSVMIPTHTNTAFLMLTYSELLTFANMLEVADKEWKALSMMAIFQKKDEKK